MGKPTVYIASSWKNQHAVELLTERLRNQGWKVLSFVENNYGEGHGPDKKMDFEAWVKTQEADRSFAYDTQGATSADLVVYIGPSGTDAWAEVGAAWSVAVPVIGLWSKGEPAGLMRKMMVAWFNRAEELLTATKTFLTEETENG
jgi:lipid-binding SYLF domain-containing protein